MSVVRNIALPAINLRDNDQAMYRISVGACWCGSMQSIQPRRRQTIRQSPPYGALRVCQLVSVRVNSESDLLVSGAMMRPEIGCRVAKPVPHPRRAGAWIGLQKPKGVLSYFVCDATSLQPSTLACEAGPYIIGLCEAQKQGSCHMYVCGVSLKRRGVCELSLVNTSD